MLRITCIRKKKHEYLRVGLFVNLKGKLCKREGIKMKESKIMTLRHKNKHLILIKIM